MQATRNMYKWFNLTPEQVMNNGFLYVGLTNQKGDFANFLVLPEEGFAVREGHYQLKIYSEAMPFELELVQVGLFSSENIVSSRQRVPFSQDKVLFNTCTWCGAGMELIVRAWRGDILGGYIPETQVEVKIKFVA